MRIDVDDDEMLRVNVGVLPFVEDDEASPIGHVLVRQRAGVRSWIATDRYRLGRFECDAEGPDFELLVNPRLIQFAQSSATYTFPAAADGARPVTLDYPHLRFTLPAGQGAYPEVDDMIADAIGKTDGEAIVDWGALQQALNTVRRRPSGASHDESPPMWLHAADGMIRLSATWEASGDTVVEVPAEITGAPAPVAVSPFYLLTLVEAGCLAPVTILFPASPGSPLVFQGAMWTGLLMPLDELRGARDQAEEILAHEVGADRLHVDDDGDLVVPTAGVHPAFVRVLRARPLAIDVRSPLAFGVDATDDVLAEINDINRAHIHGRLWLDGGIIWAAMVAESRELDPDELLRAYRVVAWLAERYSGPLTARFESASAAGSENPAA
jgi:hypothetical protein